MSLPRDGQIWRRCRPGAVWHADLVLITEVVPVGAYAGARWFAEHFEDVTGEMRATFLDAIAASVARQDRLARKLRAQASVAERLLTGDVGCGR